MAAVISEVSRISPIRIHHVDFIVPPSKVPTLARSKGNLAYCPVTMREPYP